jgi:hypothetical protein
MKPQDTDRRAEVARLASQANAALRREPHRAEEVLRATRAQLAAVAKSIGELPARERERAEAIHRGALEWLDGEGERLRRRRLREAGQAQQEAR